MPTFSLAAAGVAGLLALQTTAGAQAAPQAQTPAPQTQPVPADAPPPAAAYSYDPQGRRDPFVSLLTRGTDPSGNRPAGLLGVLIGEVVVKGVLHDRSGFVAMVQGPDARTYIVRSGQRLMDGTVKAITADSVVFAQDVTDPLSTVKQREIRKTVRPADGRG